MKRRIPTFSPASVLQLGIDLHGDRLIPQTVLEWQPFERILTQDLIPIPIPNTFALIEYRLIPTENGVRLIQSFGKATGPFLGRLLSDRTVVKLANQWQTNLESFKEHIEWDLAARREAAAPLA